MLLDNQKISRIKSALTFHSHGMSITEIARQLKMNRNSVAKYLEILQISGQAEAKIAGTSKVYTLSPRVPVSAMLGFSSDMILITDQDGKIIRVNEPFLEFAGVSRDDVVGRKFSEVPLPWLPGLYPGEKGETTGGTKDTIREIRVRCRGREVFLQVKAAQTVFEDGSEGSTVILEDITGRKNLENSLRQSEEKYRNVVESQTEFICRFRPDGTIVFSNLAYSRYFGTGAEDLAGTKFRPKIPPEDQASVTAHFASLTAEHPVQTIEHRILMPDGEIRWHQWTDRAIFDARGEIVEYQAIGRDVTERNRATRALADREKLYRSVIENIQDVFYRSDREGILILASPSWAALLGYDSLDECLGKDIADTFWMEPAQREALLDIINEKGFVRDYEVVLKRKDGSPVTVSTNSHLYYDEAGRTLGVEGILRDTSERHAAEDKIRSSMEEREFLSRKLLEFIELEPEDDIYAKIASDLKTLVPGAMVVVSSYDSATGMITLRSLQGDTDREICTECLGCSPIGIGLPVDAVALNNLRQGRLIQVPLPLYDLCFRKIPADICDRITARVHFTDTWAIGFARSGELFGNAVLYLYQGTTITNKPLIETYANQASIALQRRLLEDSLRQTTETFSEINELSPIPISIIDPDGTYRYINNSFTRLFGYTLKDFQNGRGWFLLAFPDPGYRQKAIESWQADTTSQKCGRTEPRTFSVRCRDGTDKDVIFRLVTLSDGRTCIAYEDITALVQSGRMKSLLSAIIESADVAIIGKTITGTILSWNPAAERIYGYSADEMMGKHISQIIPPDKRQEIQDILGQVSHGSSVKNLETLRVRKDGTITEVALTVSPILDADGNVTGASSIAWDISLRKAEDRLKEVEERYRTLVENIDVGVYRSTGDPKGRFVWGNPALLKILGFESLQRLGEIEIAPLFVDPDGRNALLGDLSRNGFVKNRQIVLLRADGTKITVLVTALAQINPDGKIAFISGLVEDITARSRTEADLAMARKELQDVIGFLPDPVFLIDDNRKVVAWNPAMERLTGLKKEEILNGGGYIHPPPADGRARPVLADLVDATDDQLAGYYGRVTKDGAALETEIFSPWGNRGRGGVLRVRAAPLFDPAGRRIGAIETVREPAGTRLPSTGTLPGDAPAPFPPSRNGVMPSPVSVTANLSQVPPLLSRLYLSNALKLAHDGITLVDTAARCVWANDTFTRMLGATANEAVAGRSLIDFIAQDQREVILSRLMSPERSGTFSLPLSVITAGGSIAVDTSISEITDEQGDLLGHLLIMRQIRGDRPS